MNNPRIDEKDIIQWTRCDTYALTTASNPPAKVYIPVDTPFFIEEHGNYRKLRFKKLDGEPIIIGATTVVVTVVDVTASLKLLQRMVRDPTAVSCYWTSPWHRDAEPSNRYRRTLTLHGTKYLVELFVPEEAWEDYDVWAACRDALSEHLRGADLRSVETESKVDFVAVKGENRYEAHAVFHERT